MELIRRVSWIKTAFWRNIMPLVFGKDLKKCRYLPPKRYHTRIAPKKFPVILIDPVQVSITPDKRATALLAPAKFQTTEGL